MADSLEIGRSRLANEKSGKPFWNVKKNTGGKWFTWWCRKDFQCEQGWHQYGA